jgi:N-acetylneuraminic acid mutarotase
MKKRFGWKWLIIGSVAIVPATLAAYVWIIAPEQRCPSQSGGVPLQTGAWNCVSSLPTSRSEVGVAVLDGHIYAAGGMNRWGNTAAFEVYDPILNQWRRLAPLTKPLNHLGIAGARGRIYLAGGYADLFLTKPVSDAWTYDLATNAWVSVAAMPGPRAAHLMINIDDKLYVTGGVGSDSSALWVYDPATNTWDTTRARMPTAREHAAAAVFDGKLYVIGGRRATSENLAVVEVYDPPSNTWARKRDLPTARGGLTAATLGGRIHVTGGESLSARRTFNQHDVYDPVSNTWSELAPLPKARHGLGSGVINGRWYVIGGATSPGWLTPISTSAMVDVFNQ